MLSHLYFRVYISTEHVRDSGKSNYTKEKKEVKATQSCLTLCDPMAYEVHGILQARILEWIAFPFSRRFSQLRDQTQISHIAGRFFTSRARKFIYNNIKLSQIEAKEASMKHSWEKVIH
jgi:hypothetical protein